MLNNSHAGRIASNGLEQPVIYCWNTLPYWLILKLIYQYGKPFLIKDIYIYFNTYLPAYERIELTAIEI